MQDAYAAADVAVARSGAASLTELAYFELPSVLVPYPHAADDHQTLNAQVFQKAGAGILMPEPSATAALLASEIKTLLLPERHATMALACSGLNVPNAAECVADVLLKAASAGGTN
jgi:UDP-N-acetylglucosamine--N-acetylmuramyl-(pentapeptide) pyrophosphoryl-undecaprenol N-acetylglucosamine transferase